MQYEIVVADPAKNITLFVLNPVTERVKAARSLLADPALGAEQVGFALPPEKERKLWRLEMMGGEFCGNAARSFGLFVARTQGLLGRHTVFIEISGMKGALAVQVDVRAGKAELRIPRPLSRETLDFEGKALPVYIFEGITQVIAPDLPPEKELFYRIKGLIEERPVSHEALGVMFYHAANQMMTPAVYVYGTDSLVFESSCGSGSAALGMLLSETLPDGEARHAVVQPGGVIEVRLRKERGEVTDIFIGGPVSLSGPLYIDS
jgi:diaminopimelate epimerase